MPITLPSNPAGKLTPADAAAIAKRARKLLRAGRITHRQLALLDCLLWSCRAPGAAQAIASYSTLQRLAHVSRATIAEAIPVLEGLGLLSRIKRRVRLAWHQGGQRVRQLANAYAIHPVRSDNCEFGQQTVIQGLEILHLQEPSSAAVKAAQAALAAVRDGFQARMLDKKRAGIVCGESLETARA